MLGRGLVGPVHDEAATAQGCNEGRQEVANHSRADSDLLAAFAIDIEDPAIDVALVKSCPKNSHTAKKPLEGRASIGFALVIGSEVQLHGRAFHRPIGV